MWKAGCLLVLVVGSLCQGAVHELRIPLTDGKVSTAELSRRLAMEVNLGPGVLNPFGMDVALNLRGMNSWLVLKGLNSALGEGFHFAVVDSALVVQFDPDHLPKTMRAGADAVERFTAETAPEATERQQRRLGLLLPTVVDAAKPMEIVIHGMDGDASSCKDLCRCLAGDGRQVGTFCYLGEQPIAQSAALLTSNMRALHEAFPAMKIDLITESMGGLVARKYVEGPDYAGSVNHLILIAPPNEGSGWTHLAVLEKVDSNFSEWRQENDWSLSWAITQGLGEAAGDLSPGSQFLKELNGRPRNAEIKYTIIAGNQPIHERIESELLHSTAHLISGSAAGWWGLRQARAALEKKADGLGAKTGQADGPVEVAQARLAGVSDFVVLPADHLALYRSIDDKPPAAWGTIRERLAN